MTHEQPSRVENFTLDAMAVCVAKDTPPQIEGTVFFERDFMTRSNLRLLRQSDPMFLGIGDVALDIVELLAVRGELPNDIVYVPNEGSIEPLESYICTKIPQLRAVLSPGGILSHNATNARETFQQYGDRKSNFAILFRVETGMLRSQDKVKIDVGDQLHSKIDVTRYPKSGVASHLRGVIGSHLPILHKRQKS